MPGIGVQFVVTGVSEVAARFRAASERARASLIKGLGKGALIVEGEARRTVYAGRPDHLVGDSGHLRRSITHQVDDANLSARIGSNVIYAPVHEFGATIKAKNKPYLVFQVQNLVTTSRTTNTGETVPTIGRESGGWVRVKEVTVPERPYLRPALRDKGPAARDAIINTAWEVLSP